MRVRDVWGRIVKRRYTRWLEEEVTRLRAENRALLNSILGIAGMPPIVLTPSEYAAEQSGAGGQSGSTRKTSYGSKPDGRRASGSQVQRRTLGVPVPVRHRSWQQVNRMLELDAMRNREKPFVEVSRTAGTERNGA